MIRDLLHADRVLRLLDLGLTYPQAVRVKDADAALLIEAADIAFEAAPDDEPDCIVITVGPDDA